MVVSGIVSAASFSHVVAATDTPGSTQVPSRISQNVAGQFLTAEFFDHDLCMTEPMRERVYYRFLFLGSASSECTPSQNYRSRSSFMHPSPSSCYHELK